MRVPRRLGLRARLAVALAGVAVASVALATILSTGGLKSELERSSEQRLASTTRHLAELAAELYTSERGFTPAARRELAHLAAVDGLRAGLDRPPAGAFSASAPVVVAGRRVATLTTVPADVDAYREPDRELHGRLDRLHLLAAVLAGALGLAAAVAVSAPLTGPLRRLTLGARRMEEGELDARVPATGGPELEQLAHALNRLAATLEREEQLRREATADLAHELRTPLSGILARIEAAQDGVLADEEANLAAMHFEGERLRQLLDDLGRLAEAQRPGLMIDKQPVDLVGVARGRADGFRTRFAEKHIGFDVDLRSATVQGDRGRLEQVVDNLLSNALRYTDPGGHVALRTFAEEADAVLEVADTGIGIAAEDLPHVFERFWRSDRSRARTRGGAGIGLAIVHELVRAHDGRIVIASTPGRGSTFTVRLPRFDGRARAELTR